MPTKEEIQEWAREEWARLDKEKTEAKQAACDHARSGTLADSERYNERVVICDDCGKELRFHDKSTYKTHDDKPNPAEQRGIDAMRAGRP